jgi:hypothetical protein
MLWKYPGVDYKIEVIVGPDFHGDILALASKRCVWIVDTPGNRPAIDIAWHTGEKYEMTVHGVEPDELLTRCLTRRKASTSRNKRQTVLWLSDFLACGSAWSEERPKKASN